MLGNPPFYFSLMRKYVAVIGTLFNDISIVRETADGSDTQIIKVPLTYAPKEKVKARFIQDPNLDRPISVELPMISFEMVGMQYDKSRKLNSLDYVTIQSPDKKTVKYQYNPVPWNFIFRIAVWVKNTEDGTKIMEQILPFFNPDITVTANLIDGFNHVVDLPITLGELAMEDQYEGSFEERKVFLYNFTLQLKGVLYGPVIESGVIKIANVNMYVPSTDTAAEGINITKSLESVIMTPGLTANGQPTTDYTQSISPLLINADDTFGYCERVYPYPPVSTNNLDFTSNTNSSMVGVIETL